MKGRDEPQRIEAGTVGIFELRGLTFELSGRQRQDARPGLAKMYRVPPDRAWWPAVGAPLERGVRPHSRCQVLAAEAADAAGTGAAAPGATAPALQLTDFSIQKATLPTKATLPETTVEATRDTAPPST